MQPSHGGETYEIGVSGLLELLLGGVTNVGIWRESVELRGPTRRGEGNLPAEKVPSNTWLISMIAGGCVKESKRGI